jgi:hypothetical protein
MMGMMSKPLVIRVVMMIGALLLVPLPNPFFGGEFLRVLVSPNVGSHICLHGVRVFEQVVRLRHGTAGQYGWAVAVPLVAKASAAWFLCWLPPRCKNNWN